MTIPVLRDGSQVVNVTFTPIRKDVRQATNKLKDKLEENNIAKTIDMKPSTPPRNHGAVIVKDSDAREA